jgi:hypothetical protein
MPLLSLLQVYLLRCFSEGHSGGSSRYYILEDLGEQEQLCL